MCGTRSPGALCGEKGSQLRGKRNLAALVSLKVWAGQNSSARLSPAVVKITVVLSIIIKY